MMVMIMVVSNGKVLADGNGRIQGQYLMALFFWVAARGWQYTAMKFKEHNKILT